MATWLVTGANRGIGLGLTKRLLAAGQDVIATARDTAAAVELSRLAETQPTLTVLAMDATSDPSVAAAAAEIAGRPVHVLVNNAGVYGPKAQGGLDVDLDGFLDTLSINTVAPFRVLRAFAPNLAAAGRGAKFVVISSTMGSITAASTGVIAYRASKAAVNKAVQASARELLGRGIVSVVMHPGWVRTDMGGAGADLSVEEATAGIVATIGKLTEADAGRFLAWDGRPAAW
jgi:NAD(P)-dependent dehydrogenase (short-subunit alcohol dehydrogenase family)